jgi:hypothetical protein
MRQYEREDVEYETWYSSWMKRLAKAHTKEELEAMYEVKKADANKAAYKHLKAIQKSHSMSSNSMARAHSRNCVAAAGEYAIALDGAIEIHDLFPEEAKQ